MRSLEKWLLIIIGLLLLILALYAYDEYQKAKATAIFIETLKEMG